MSSSESAVWRRRCRGGGESEGTVQDCATPICLQWARTREVDEGGGALDVPPVEAAQRVGPRRARPHGVPRLGQVAPERGEDAPRRVELPRLEELRGDVPEEALGVAEAPPLGALFVAAARRREDGEGGGEGWGGEGAQEGGGEGGRVRGDALDEGGCGQERRIGAGERRWLFEQR